MPRIIGPEDDCKNDTVYYSEIKYTRLSKSCIQAECKMWVGNSYRRMTVVKSGKTEYECELAILDFLSGSGMNEIKCIRTESILGNEVNNADNPLHPTDDFNQA